MYVRFWGTRGSIAAPGWRTARFGGNTSCAEVRARDGTLIVLDCGTGARDLGLHLLSSGPRPLRVHLFIGHTHWDHIQGFPFFAPGFVPGVELNIYAPVGFQRSLEEAMAGQMEYSYFPVKLKDLRSRIHFTELDEGFFRVGDVLVETQYLNHTAPTIAYRMTSGDVTVAYVTDHEPFWKPSDQGFEHPGDQRHIEFLRGTHLLIHDAQYTSEEYQGKIGWGHSPIEYVTDIAMAAGVARLALFHHDPLHDDETMERLQAGARQRVIDRGGAMDVFAAAEGLELEAKGGGTVTTVTDASALRRMPIAGRRVLLINSDDDEVSAIERELIEDSLALASVSDGRGALEQAQETSPDVVIVSGRLPDADGISLIGPLRDVLSRPDLPVLLLTDEPDLTVHGHGAAPTDYLVRPFSAPMLRSRVRAWLSRTLVERARVETAPETAPPGVTGGTGSRGREAITRYAELLMAMPLFRSLKRGQLEALASHAIDQVYPVAHEIIREGATADSLFVILSGRVRVTESGRDVASELLLGELGPGQIFGEMGVLRNQPRTANVVAVERTHCLMLAPGNFLRAVQTVPELALGLLRVLAGRLAEADRRLARYAPDPLTSLMSRRAFSDQYRRLAAGARRRASGVLLLVLDVFQLRTINDRFGYTIGDEVLKTVAEALLEATRTTDLVTRHGGDEFAVLLVDAVPDDADRVVRRVRAALTDAAPRHDLPLAIQSSIGVTVAMAPPEEPDELFRDADLDMRRRRNVA